MDLEIVERSCYDRWSGARYSNYDSEAYCTIVMTLVSDDVGDEIKGGLPVK